jgi:hydrogenase 3 maturation protease
MKPGLAAHLRARLRGEIVVVGIGNPLRGDDGVGSLVARHLLCAQMREGPPSLRVIDAEEIPEAFLGPITRPAPETVVLVDAVNMGGVPGTTALLEMEDVAGREAFTHSAPLTLLARFIRSETGADVLLIGIQPGHRRLGGPPSPEVTAAALSLAGILDSVSRMPEWGAQGPGVGEGAGCRDQGIRRKPRESPGCAEGRPC